MFGFIFHCTKFVSFTANCTCAVAIVQNLGGFGIFIMKAYFPGSEVQKKEKWYLAARNFRQVTIFWCYFVARKKNRIYFKHRVESLLANNLQPAWFFLNYKTCYLLCTIGWQPLWNAARSFSKGFKFDLLTLQELCKRMLERIKSCKDNQQHSSISLQHLAWSP